MKKFTFYLMLLFTAIAFEASAQMISYNVTVPAGTKVCYIAGDMNGWVQQPMTRVDSTHYKISFTSDHINDGYKYCSGPGWAYEELNGTGATIPNRKYISGSDIVLEWRAIYNPTNNPIEKDVLIKVTVHDSVKVCYLAGSFDNWSVPGVNNKMTRGLQANGKVVFSKIIHTLNARTLQYKFCAGPAWEFVQKVEANFIYPANEDSVSVTVDSFWRIFDPAQMGTIKVNAFVPTGTKKAWIMGDFVYWDMSKAIEGKMNANGTFTFIVPFVQSMQYRLYNNNDWGHPEVGQANPTLELPNRSATYPADSITNITVWGWKLSSDSIADTVAPTAPTGLKNTDPTSNSFYLSWQPSTDNVGVVGYNVYKDSVYYSSTPFSGMDITGLAPNRAYKMKVRARDAAGNVSAESSVLVVKTLPDTSTGVTFNVKVPSGTYQCWVVGNFNDWNNSLNQMSRVDSTHYTITLDASTFPVGITKNNLEYKYLSGAGDWAYVEKDSLGGEIQNRFYSAADVVGKWLNVYNPNIPPLPMDLTIKVKTPVGTNECYIVGTYNKWAGPTAPNSKMTKLITNSDGTVMFEITIHTDDANKLVYHFCSGPDWSYAQKIPALDFKYPEILPVVTSWVEIYDPLNIRTIKIKATVPNGTEKVWIQGSHLGWDMTKAVEGAKNTDGTFSFVVPNVTSVEYRLYNKPDWDFPEIDSLGQERVNRIATFPADSTINVKVLGWRHIVDSISDNVAPSIPTGLKNTDPTSNSFYLSWQPSTDNVGVVGYNVYINSIYLAYTTFLGLNITDLIPNSSFKMTVQAKDAAENLSESSTVLVVKTLPDTSTGITFNVKVPIGTYQCWIVGNFNNWNNSLNQMTRVDSTHYKITLYESTFTSGITKDSLQYKYLSGGGDWAYVEKDSVGGEILNRRYQTNDVVAKWNTIYNPNILPLPMDLTITVTTPIGTNECYIVGNFNNWAGPTDPGSKMTKVNANPDGTVVFKISGHTEDANKFVYHFCSGPDWTYEQKSPIGDFKYPLVNPIVTEWKSIFDPSKAGTIKINATVPVGTQQVWIMGSHLGWDMTKAVEGLKNPDGTFSFSVPIVKPIEYRLYNQPDLGFAEIDVTGAERPVRVASFPPDSVTNITVYGWKQVVDTISGNNIHIQYGAGGNVSENNILLNSGTYLQVNKGDTKTFTIQPNPGFKIETLFYNGQDVKSQLVNNQFTTPAVNGNATLNITFQKTQYRLSIKSAESGIISLICEYGATPTFEFTPSESWKINSVYYNGINMTAALASGYFTIPPVTEDVLLNISFEFQQTALFTPSGSNIKVYTTNSEIVIEGISAGEIVRLFSENGAALKVLKSQGDRMVIPALPDAIYLVKTATKTVKVIL